MKNIIKDFALCLLAFGIAVAVCLAIEKKKIRHEGLPEGWEMWCDRKGNFAPARFGHAVCDYDGFRGRNLPYPSKQRAIDRAWEQVEFEARPAEQTSAEKYNLHPCNE